MRKFVLLSGFLLLLSCGKKISYTTDETKEEGSQSASELGLNGSYVPSGLRCYGTPFSSTSVPTLLATATLSNTPNESYLMNGGSSFSSHYTNGTTACPTASLSGQGVLTKTESSSDYSKGTFKVKNLSIQVSNESSCPMLWSLVAISQTSSSKGTGLSNSKVNDLPLGQNSSGDLAYLSGLVSSAKNGNQDAYTYSYNYVTFSNYNGFGIQTNIKVTNVSESICYFMYEKL